MVLSPFLLNSQVHQLWLIFVVFILLERVHSRLWPVCSIVHHGQTQKFHLQSDKKKSVTLSQRQQKHNSSCPVPLPRFIHLLQISLSIFHSCSFQSPDYPAIPLANTLKLCTVTHKISSLNQSLQPSEAIVLSSHHLISSHSFLLFYQGAQEIGHRAVTVYFLAMPTYHVDQSVIKALIFSSAGKRSYRCRLEEQRQYRDIGNDRHPKFLL